jgi:hypothetical protein
MLTVNNDGGSEACLSLCTHWQQQSINDKSEVHCSQFMPKSANHYAPFCSSSLRARCGGVRQGLPARWSPCLWRIFCGISYLPRCFSFECRHTDGHKVYRIRLSSFTWHSFAVHAPPHDVAFTPCPTIFVCCLSPTRWFIITIIGFEGLSDPSHYLVHPFTRPYCHHFWICDRMS